MSPNSDRACSQGGVPDCALAALIARMPATGPSAGDRGAKALLCRSCRRVMAKLRDPLEVHGALFGAQYTARIRPVALLFPHDPRPGTSVMRRNVPITTPRGSQNGNGQAAKPGRFAGMSRLRLRLFRRS